jgi:hypothetical protein
MKKQLLALSIIALALSAHADAPPTPPAAKATAGEIVMEQQTRTEFAPNGQPTRTKSSVQVTMRAENGVVWSMIPGWKWQISKGTELKVVNPRTTRTADEARANPPRMPDTYGFTSQILRPIDSGMIGKKVEDDVTIAGEWATYQRGPTSDRPAWTEKWEKWFRVDKGPDGKSVIRSHRLVTTSIYETTTIDYFYFQSTRLHEALFDMGTNP